LNQNKQNTLGDTEHQKRAADFIRAVERVLRGICRLLVRRGIGVASGVELMKRAILQGAADVAAEQGLPVTAKRLQLYTGIPRGEIERLRATIASNVDLSEAKFAAISRLISTWHLDRNYVLQFLDTPRELPIADDDGQPSFTGLFAECFPQYTAQQAAEEAKGLLEELVRINAVMIVPETNLVRLLARAYIPEPFQATDSERFGRRLANYVDTLDINSRKAGPGLGHFDRHVSADWPISREDEAEFHAYARQLCQETLEKLDTYLRSKAPVPENGRRVGTTIFYYVETDVNAHVINGDDTVETKSSASADKKAIESLSVDDETDVIDTLTFRVKGKK
jgi:hypothetical protein